MSASEMDKLEMLAALEEQPAKPIAVEASADAGRLSSENQSSEVQASEASDLDALDLAIEAMKVSSIPLIELAQILDEHKMLLES